MDDKLTPLHQENLHIASLATSMVVDDNFIITKGTNKQNTQAADLAQKLGLSETELIAKAVDLYARLPGFIEDILSCYDADNHIGLLMDTMDSELFDTPIYQKQSLSSILKEVYGFRCLRV